ncbi:MAG: 4-hydroxybenzoyl-CoA thioesterase [Caballeronia sp.]|jgi:acyl-CoA thioesterase FadM|nr:4-hydroxybenzoyl-CoA thioesterase [Caballeronia sp.]
METSTHFEQPVRIRFSHCNPAGIVFFPQYLVMTNALAALAEVKDDVKNEVKVEPEETRW